MLKIVMLLDCNECGCSLSEAQVRSSSLRTNWDTELAYLKIDAESRGWGFVHGFYSVCPSCVERQIAEDNWLQGEHEQEQA